MNAPLNEHQHPKEQMPFINDKSHNINPFVTTESDKRKQTMISYHRGKTTMLLIIHIVYVEMIYVNYVSLHYQ